MQLKMVQTTETSTIWLLQIITAMNRDIEGLVSRMEYNANRNQFVILCDMDGTLINTNFANYLSYSRAIQMVTCKKNSIQYEPHKRLNRNRLKEIIPYLTNEQQKQIVSLKTDYFIEYLPQTTVNNTLVDVLCKYRETNQIFLVTHSRKKRAIETLQYHNLQGLFNQLICWEALQKNKSTNKYMNALDLVGANATDFIVFEDDAFEIKNAMLAGILQENIFHVEYLK